MPQTQMGKVEPPPEDMRETRLMLDGAGRGREFSMRLKEQEKASLGRLRDLAAANL